MENLTKTMLLTSSIKIDTREVVSKLENEILESIGVQKIKDDWQKIKKRLKIWMWITLFIYETIIVLCTIWLWKAYLLQITDIEHKDKIAITIFILLCSLAIGFFISMKFDKSPSDYHWYKNFNSIFKEETQKRITEIQIKIYGEILNSIFASTNLDFETKLKNYIATTSNERSSNKANNYLQGVIEKNLPGNAIENDFGNYYLSFFEYCWAWDFIEEKLQDSVYIQKIYLNNNNLFCILLEGNLLDSQFAGFNSEKIFSKEYVKIWKG